MKRLDVPLSKDKLVELTAGDEVLLSGVIYTARDQAHKRLVELIRKNKPLPFSMAGVFIYYCGPTPAPPGEVIGSCGPTTASRMDKFVEPLLKQGAAAMIGKGGRAGFVRDLIKRYGALYFTAPAGCGALLSEKVLAKELVCFRALGPEAVYKLTVRDFPLLVAIDAAGESIYSDT